MRVAVTDFTFPSLDIEEAVLSPLGIDVVGHQCKSSDELVAAVRAADAVLTQFAPVTGEVIGAMDAARVIVRYGIGVDNVDLVAARERGVPVCNVPAYCLDEVADHTVAFILSATRRVLANCLHVRKGEWGLPVSLNDMCALRDLTVGIVGFGRIGREVAARLRPFKCRLLVCDPVVGDDVVTTSGCELSSFDDLLTASDVISLHCPSSPETRKLFDAEAFARMKPGAVLVNLARGDLVDTDALIGALESGRLGAAALDVCDPEPIPTDSPLRRLENVVVSSHVASASAVAVEELRKTAAGIAADVLQGRAPINVVNGVGEKAHE
ncbi:MAG: C-terminal binding protein [Planctomycetota bacterium]